MKKGLIILLAAIVAFVVGLYAFSWGASRGAFFLVTDVQEEAYEPLADAEGVVSKTAGRHSGYEVEYGLVALYAFALAVTAAHVTHRLCDHFGKTPVIAGVYEINTETDGEGHSSIIFEECYEEGC